MPPATTTPASPPLDPRRALTLDQVLGNESVRLFLRQAWTGGRLPQALLFTGPAGIGKTTLAWALAREITAQGRDPATHPGALKIERQVHPDIFEVTGKESVSSMILVKDIRDIENRVYTPPLESPRKIVLIEPAERMNESAGNCLLKILEEPPPQLLFFLITPEPNRLLDTIRSRATEIRLEPVAGEQLADWLAAKTGLEQSRARLLALLSEGRPGVALNLAGSGALEARGEILTALNLLVQHGFAAVFTAASKLMGIGGGLAETLTVMIALLRDALVLKMRGEGALNQDLIEPLTELAEKRSAAGLLEAARRLERAAAEAPYFYQPQAKAHFMECLVIDLGRLLRS